MKAAKMLYLLSETYSALPEPTAAEKSLNSDHVIVKSIVTERQVINPSVNGIAVEFNITTEPPPVQVAKEDPKRAPIAAPPPPAPTQRDVTKKSYASIVKDRKDGPPAVPVARTTPSVPKNEPPPKPITKDVEGPVKPSAKPAQDNETTASDGIGAESNSSHNEQGYSVFVRNLPFYANIDLVEEEFKKFGTVKPDGVQVVHHRFDGFCFGFVEYESEQSMQAAIKASPVCIGEKNVFIEKKSAPTRVTRFGAFPRGHNSEGGRFQAGSGVYRGDNFGGQACGYGNNANYRGGDNFNQRNGRENYNSRNDGGENYNRRGNAGENYNHRNEGGENYNRRNDGSKNYNRRADFGENYNRRNDGGENNNRRGDVGESDNRRGNVGENYNRRGDGGENNNRRGDGGENNNRRGHNGENYSQRNDGGENYKRGGDGGENYNRRNDGGENYNRRNDRENFNRRNNFRNQKEFPGGRGQGPPPGIGYHQNGNGFHPPRPVQNGNGRSARVNGPKQLLAPGAA